MAEKQAKKVEILNKRARHDFHFIDVYEAGIQLQGTEIKSIRAGHVNLKDAFCIMKKGELFVRNLYIKEYDFGTYSNHEPRQVRKLLLRRGELKKLERKVKERGFAIVPYKMFLNERGFAKLQIALAQGKKSHDKRESIKDRDTKRDLARIKKIR